MPKNTMTTIAAMTPMDWATRLRMKASMVRPAG
jgi:hypothetical protein